MLNTQANSEQNEKAGAHSTGRSSAFNQMLWAGYTLAIAVSISPWFLAIRAPLWLDETGSYWPISAGFSQIWPRTFSSMSFIAYSYILWFWTKLFGNSEIALRALSVLAMLGAVYLLYLAARELFERDIAFIAAVIFCLHQIVVFASIDVRPYAFAALATNRRNQSPGVRAANLGECPTVTDAEGFLRGNTSLRTIIDIWTGSSKQRREN